MSPIEPIHWERIAIGLRIPSLISTMGLLRNVSFALEVLGDRWEAEEVIQDVFAYIWRKPEVYSPVKESLPVGYFRLPGIGALIADAQ